MRAALRTIEYQPEPSTLSGDPAEFSFLARLIIGPPDAPGGESLDVTVCTPEWLAAASRRVGGIYDARHHVVVNLDDFNQRALRDWLASRVHEAEAASWPEVGRRLGRLGQWEFEDYRPGLLDRDQRHVRAFVARPRCSIMSMCPGSLTGVTSSLTPVSTRIAIAQRC